MEYFCEKCNYNTKNKSDYNRHLKSAKHKHNSAKIYNCLYCNKDFIVKSSYYKHRKGCYADKDNFKNDDLKIKLILANCENEKTKMKLEHTEEKLKMLEEIVKKSNKTTDKALKITSKTISALKYANENFKDAPVLSPIENYNVMNYDLNDEEDKKKLIEDLLFYYRKNSLHTIFGKHIISEYKKDNIKEQSMHTTDTSRMNYIIRTQDNNNSLKWSQDKNGVFVCNNLIDKLINYHIDTLKWYHKLLIDDISLDPTRLQPSLQKKIENISNLLSDIESGQILKDTNKYIAPFFNLDK
jgi:hypothetical protein